VEPQNTEGYLKGRWKVWQAFEKGSQPNDLYKTDTFKSSPDSESSPALRRERRERKAPDLRVLGL
jgi:hypothetical protein